MKRITLILATLLLSAIAVKADEQQPIYIVDGIETPFDVVRQIVATDIESLTVVRDPAAIAQYNVNGDTSNGIIVISLREEDPNEQEWLVVDEMPRFMNGDVSTFVTWVMQNVRYPAEAIEANIQGMVVAQFVVGRDGYIIVDRTRIIESPDAILTNEVLRVLSLSPRWTPGKQRGENVQVSFTIPVNFAL